MGVLEETVLILVFESRIIELLKAVEVQVWKIRVHLLALFAYGFQPLVVDDGRDVEPEIKRRFAFDFDAEVTPYALLELFEVYDQVVAGGAALEEVGQLLDLLVFLHFLLGFEFLVDFLPFLPRKDLFYCVLLQGRDRHIHRVYSLRERTDTD